jgi:hypothetical protein
MKTFLITYDLHTPGNDYNKLFSAIRRLSSMYWHGMQNAWFIKSDTLSGGSIRDALSSYVDANDVIFVTELKDWASWGLEGWEWLNG